jgi:hypothetical protein
LRCAAASFGNQSIIVWTSKTKSLLPSFYKREEFPLFGKEGEGEIFTTICLFNYGLLSNNPDTGGIISFNNFAHAI